MEFIGQVQSKTIDYYSCNPIVSFVLSDKFGIDDIPEGELKIKIVKNTKKRSLNANNYAWKLMTDIADKLHLPVEEVYRREIKEVGKKDAICILDDAADEFIKIWQSQGLGWQAEKTESKLEGCVTVIIYYGSSTYDTNQMSVLIDNVVQEAKALGIRTETPEELARMKEDWKYERAKGKNH